MMACRISHWRITCRSIQAFNSRITSVSRNQSLFSRNLYQQFTTSMASNQLNSNSTSPRFQQMSSTSMTSSSLARFGSPWKSRGPSPLHSMIELSNRFWSIDTASFKSPIMLNRLYLICKSFSTKIRLFSLLSWP